ncbi:hypothetical protein JK364_50510 [Streptomyces sp. 110]|uniref:Uncharacterized protein n=1 Tax=Streptomyces endocoffeicus TaxID=2898945 RepID=A0ABS1Q8M3_9ACTN|nr:hypothetical protein [Streptomyces endocoffeicus]MBL1120472.1 hypothetical protein [Streptomyces endocoffeicus]
MDTSYDHADPRLETEARDLLTRLAKPAGFYDYGVPMAARHLDMAIDTGKLGLITGDDSATLLTIEEVAGRLGTGDSGDVRKSIHRLHAGGAMLVEVHERTPLLRIVAGRPKNPGDPWNAGPDG